MADDKRWREVFKKLDEINERLTAVSAALETIQGQPLPAPKELRINKPAPVEK